MIAEMIKSKPNVGAKTYPILIFNVSTTTPQNAKNPKVRNNVRKICFMVL